MPRFNENNKRRLLTPITKRIKFLVFLGRPKRGKAIVIILMITRSFILPFMAHIVPNLFT